MFTGAGDGARASAFGTPGATTNAGATTTNAGAAFGFGTPPAHVGSAYGTAPATPPSAQGGGGGAHASYGVGAYGANPSPATYGVGGAGDARLRSASRGTRADDGSNGAGAVAGKTPSAPRFSSLLFSSPGGGREGGAGGGAQGLFRTESKGGGSSTPRTSSGQNRYFGANANASGNRARGGASGDERAVAASAAVIGGVSSRGTPLFTRTDAGGDDHTPGFLRRAIEKTHAEARSEAGVGSEEALRSWLGVRETEHAGATTTTTTTSGASVFGKPAAAAAPVVSSRAFAGEALSEAEAEFWVTVYGFTRDETAVVLREFQRDGDIVNFGAFSDDGAPSNWLHVRFATKESARRAQRRNGQNIGGIMVGVKALDDKARADITLGVAGEGRISRSGSQVRRVAPSRDGIALQPRERTTMDKLVEFVFGA